MVTFPFPDATHRAEIWHRAFPRATTILTPGGRAAANANHVRWEAEEALIKAKESGYTQVEVYINAEGRTVADVQAGVELARR